MAFGVSWTGKSSGHHRSEPASRQVYVTISGNPNSTLPGATGSDSWYLGLGFDFFVGILRMFLPCSSRDCAAAPSLERFPDLTLSPVDNTSPIRYYAYVRAALPSCRDGAAGPLPNSSLTT